MMQRFRKVTAGLILVATGASAAANSTNLIEQWTFEGPTPQMGVNGTSVDLWAANAPNSVAENVLTFMTSGDSDYGQGRFSNPIATATLQQLILTIDASDMLIGYANGTDTIRFLLTTDAGALELEINAWNGSQIAPDLEQGLNNKDDLDITLMEQDKLAGRAIPLVMVCNWDFVNQSMSFVSSGTASVSESAAAANLANMTQITGFQIKTTHPFGNADTFMNLKTVTIQAVINSVENQSEQPGTLGFVH